MKIFIFYYILFSLILFQCSVCAQEQISVSGSDSTSTFNNLSLALNQANTGDTLKLHGSSFSYGNAIIEKKLIIVGPGFFLGDNFENQSDLNSAQLGDIYLSPTSQGCELVGLTIDNIEVESSNVVIDRCLIYGQINIDSDFPTDSIQITRCYFSPTTEYLIDAHYADGLTIKNCLVNIQDSSSNSKIRLMQTSSRLLNNVIINLSGLYVSNSTIKNNYFHNVEIDFSTSSEIVASHNAANNDIFGMYSANSNQDLSVIFSQSSLPDTLFSFSSSASRDGRFVLNSWPNNPLVESGLNGIEVGIFGGPTPYTLSGIPPFPFTDTNNNPGLSDLDINLDGVINSGDLLVVLGNFGCATGSCIADINDDLAVNTADLTLMLIYFGQSY